MSWEGPDRKVIKTSSRRTRQIKSCGSLRWDSAPGRRSRRGARCSFHFYFLVNVLKHKFSNECARNSANRIAFFAAHPPLCVVHLQDQVFILLLFLLLNRLLHPTVRSHPRRGIFLSPPPPDPETLLLSQFNLLSLVDASTCFVLCSHDTRMCVCICVFCAPALRESSPSRN